MGFIPECKDGSTQENKYIYHINWIIDKTHMLISSGTESIW